MAQFLLQGEAVMKYHAWKSRQGLQEHPGRGRAELGDRAAGDWTPGTGISHWYRAAGGGKAIYSNAPWEGIAWG